MVKGRTIFDAINIAIIQRRVEWVTPPTHPRHRGNVGFSVIKITGIKKVADYDSKLNGDRRRDAGNEAKFEPPHGAPSRIDRNDPYRRRGRYDEDYRKLALPDGARIDRIEGVER